MKNKILLIIALLQISFFLQAQTWNGNTSTDWNTASNWTPAGVPVAAGNVTIPNTTNKPKLAGSTTITSISMSAGSAIDFNGFSLTASGTFSIQGATLNNTKAATDIVLTTAGGGSNYFGGSTVNDNITINQNGTSVLYEGYGTADVFNGNAVFVLASSGLHYSCYNQKSSFNGNLSVTRTTAGATYLFNAGFNAITGNLTYTNTVGGLSNINPNSTPSGAIGGTINITASGAGNPSFEMNRILNLTTGGTISIQNSGGVSLQTDTLKVTALNINGFTGAASDYLRRNTITGNVTFTDAATNTGSIYVGENTITGNTTFGSNGTSAFYEGYANGSIYNGNTSFNISGTDYFYTSYNGKSSFNGNLSISRSGIGPTYLFNAGFNTLTGNFSYTNAAGGITNINAGNVASGTIGGTVNITATGTGNPAFEMNRIKNLTTGGSILVQNSGGVSLQYDTLKVTTLTISGFTGAASDYLRSNSISGNVTFSDGATSTGSVYVGENVITGNTAFASNGTSAWYEGYSNGSIYNGNTTFTITGTDYFYSSYNGKSSFNGNLSVSRTGAGATYLFNAGFNTLTGNFGYTNTAGGLTNINPSSVASGTIGGTINITANGTGNPTFEMNRMVNLTTGGSVLIQNSGGVSLQNDTLKVVELTVNGFTGAASDYFRRNVVMGNVTFADAATNTGSTYVGESIITGNTALASNGTSFWYESYSNGDTYNGNVSFTRSNGGTFYIAYNDTAKANQNVVFNSATGIDVNTTIKFGGGTNAIIEQLGTQPITMPMLVMGKTGGATLTLNDSVTVTSGANFISGNIYSSVGKNLIFPNNITYTNASVASHVVGPVTKIGDDVFIFPVGGPLSINTVAMTAPTGATSRFTALYKNQNASSDGFNTNTKAASLTNVSKAGYWNVTRELGATNVALTFGFGTNPYEQYPALANLKVAQWNGSQWTDKGNGGTTGTAAEGTIKHAGELTAYGNFALANVISTYFYVYTTPGAGPDGTPVKFRGIGGYAPYSTKQLPAGAYSLDSVYLVPNGTSASFKLKDSLGVEKDDTTVTVAAAPTTYISANGNGTINFTGWRNFVYVKNAGNQIIGAIKDNGLTLGNTTMTAYFSTANVATAPNGNIYLKRSFKITSQLAPAGTKRVRFYITKTEFTNLQAADPTSFPNGINSVTITKYTGPQEDSLFNPIPGGNSTIIPNSDITIADLGTMYSLDIDVTGFSGFYIGGISSNLALCPGSTIAVSSNITGASYQWQVDNGSGFTNIGNSGIYSGATTKSLTLTNAPSTMYGYKLRAVVNGNTFSQIYTIKFNALWQGTVNNSWENVGNWSCGVLPDAGTDVLIQAGKPNYPQVSSSTSIRSLRATAGASITIKNGVAFKILK